MEPDLKAEEWKSSCNRICTAMIEEVRNFTTPISKVVENDYGELEGSGSYLEIAGSIFLVTNEHVAARMKTHSLAHKFAGCPNYYRVRAFAADPLPHDVALGSVAESIWTHSPHQARAIPLNRFACRHSPVPREVFFVCGYAGENSNFAFGNLHTPGQPFLTQEAPMPANFGDATIHFALLHSTAGATPIDASFNVHLPSPPGWSGSLVWNTRFAEASRAGQSWDPSLAQVTGILWGWPSGEICLLATKVEFLDLLALKQNLDDPRSAT